MQSGFRLHDRKMCFLEDAVYLTDFLQYFVELDKLEWVQVANKILPAVGGKPSRTRLSVTLWNLRNLYELH